MVADDIPPDRMNARPIAAFIADYPVSDSAKRQLIELYTSKRDPLAGRTRAQKVALLEHTSYRDWITKVRGFGAEVADTFQDRSHDFFAAGIDAVPAGWALETGYPGFAGLGLGAGTDEAEMEDPYIYHFPDGNASIARLLVRSLIAGVAPGRGMEDIVLAPFDYSRLDAEGALVRLRLRSTAVRYAIAAGKASTRSTCATAPCAPRTRATPSWRATTRWIPTCCRNSRHGRRTRSRST